MLEKSGRSLDILNKTFFINIVENAQKQSKRTSGAISTTKIGEFLTEDKPVENILDQLVSTPVSQKNAVKEKQVLTQQVEPQQNPPQQEKIQKDILDRLTDK